ncbi:MAG TPA: carboxypeptidase-like regulatory domain-containing protein [Candidatus Acidoferrales bacterium]|nr:carboxypeptidase-like regulatory domain-containing protein [Candidatus Acidoferrales bacterium]
MNWKLLRVPCLILTACCALAPIAAAQHEGKISGLVVDGQGIPQMGATVLVASEHALNPGSLNLLTNASGRFSTAILPSGSYTVKVSLAGFLPALEQHVEVSDQHITLLQVMMGSVFSSFGQLRRTGEEKVSSDDWTWVLRESPDTRSVLRWTEGPALTSASMNGAEAAAQKQADHVAMQVTSGGDHPGSIGAAAADSPATTLVYDMGVGDTARLVMAGQFSYSPAAPAGGFVAEWLPSGATGSGHMMVLEARQARFGPVGPVFRGVRLADSNKLAIGDRVSLRYGAEFVVAGFDNGTTQSLRPHGEVAIHVAPTWLVSAIVAAQSPEGPESQDAVQSALNNLDDFPVLMIRDGRPVLESDWHEEFSVDHAVTNDSDISAAVFHDRSSHTGVIGHGDANFPEFLQDYFSGAFAYDGGVSSSGGVRVAYRQRFGSDLQTTLIYAYGGALAPNGDRGAALREELSTVYEHSVGGRVTARVPHLGTQLSAGYKWISGPAVSQVDAYGESLYQIDPYLSLELRQPLPKALPCHMEFVADAGNLLAQGYVPLSTTDGRVVLVSSYRFFRGGLSLQF